MRPSPQGDPPNPLKIGHEFLRVPFGDLITLTLLDDATKELHWMTWAEEVDVIQRGDSLHMPWQLDGVLLDGCVLRKHGSDSLETDPSDKQRALITISCLSDLTATWFMCLRLSRTVNSVSPMLLKSEVMLLRFLSSCFRMFWLAEFLDSSSLCSSGTDVERMMWQLGGRAEA